MSSVEPELVGCVVRNASAEGCQAYVAAQVAAVRRRGRFPGPRRVLIIGASSGFGLAARLQLAFGGGSATYGIAFERAPSAEQGGSAGWYKQQAFDQLAREQGVQAESRFADAFLPATRAQTLAWIRTHWGQVDLLVYSLASSVRIREDGQRCRAVIKSLHNPLEGWGLDLAAEQLIRQQVEVATAQELADTEAVMGGDSWHAWVSALQQADLLAPGFRTLAFSYEGPAFTHAWYRDGTLGAAKRHLRQTADQLRNALLPLQGDARVVMCKALVTRASLVIPFLPIYLMLLMAVMKEKGLHEECLQQMARLFADQLYGPGAPRCDALGRWRLDELELRADVQHEVLARRAALTAENFRTLGDYDGLRAELLRQHGFAPLSG